MWKAAAGKNVQVSNNSNEDEWETDPDFVNNISEEEQRWGKTRDVGSIDMNALLEQARKEDAELKKKTISESQQSSYGYGGKYGVQADRMDKSAVGHDHIEKVEKHASQKDYATGFGGKFGVQKDRMDKSAVGHDYIGKVDKHASQKDYAVGFGGKYGVQTDRMDKSAVGHDYDGKVDKHASQKDYAVGFGGKFGVQTDRVDKTAHGWDYQEKVEKHESQTDYAKGFGGKFGVQTDRVDKAAHGWDYQEKVEKHESQTDYAKGFGGKFGVQTDRQDSSAKGFEDEQGPVGTVYEKVKPVVAEKGKASQLKSRFESLAEENKKAAEPKVVPKSSSMTKIAKLQSKFANAEAPAPNTGKAAPPEPIKLPEKVPEPVKLPEKVPEPVKLPEKVPEPVKLPEKVPEPVKLPRKVPEPEPEPEPLKVAEPVPSSVLPIPAAFQDLGEQEPLEEDNNEWDDDVSTQHQYTNQQYATIPEETTAESGEHYYAEEAEDVYQQVEPANSIPRAGITAIAIYDYQAADEDEISFDPDDIITNIEMIDEGWWRGECRGQVGLFPANYVQVQE